MRTFARSIGVLAVLLFLAAPAGSADYRSYGQVTIDNTSGGVAITATVLKPVDKPQMRHCLLRLETAEIRFRVDDGAPTTTVGVPMEPLEVMQFDSPVDLAAWRGIRTGSTSGTLDVACWF